MVVRDDMFLFSQSARSCACGAGNRGMPNDTENRSGSLDDSNLPVFQGGQERRMGENGQLEEKK